MYTLMGANGNITSKTARLLLAQGETVRVIGRDAIRLKPLRDAGAELALGDAVDASFLAQAFRGANAVYTMIPPELRTPDYRHYQRAVGEAIAQAIAKSGVTLVVSLSSASTSSPASTSCTSGLATSWKTTIATRDIAAAVAKELVRPSFKGHVVKYLLGPRSLTMREAAGILGAAIGKTDLTYVQADPAQAKAGMVQQGFSRNVADLLEEMDRALSDGRINGTFIRDAGNCTPTTLESFAPIFAQAYSTGGA